MEMKSKKCYLARVLDKAIKRRVKENTDVKDALEYYKNEYFELLHSVQYLMEIVGTNGLDTSKSIPEFVRELAGQLHNLEKDLERKVNKNHSKYMNLIKYLDNVGGELGLDVSNTSYSIINQLVQKLKVCQHQNYVLRRVLIEIDAQCENDPYIDCLDLLVKKLENK